MKSKMNRSKLLLIALYMIPAMPLAAQVQEKKDSTRTEQNIKALDYLIPKRRAAEKFASHNGTEHLFISTALGVGHLLDTGSGQSASGPALSIYVGNWITPVIGIRGGFDYGMWSMPNGSNINLVGLSADYLVNLSAFAAHYNSKRLFEVIGTLGIGYRAVFSPDAPTLHTYGLRSGLQAKFNISSTLNLFIEPQLMLYPDRVDNAHSWRRFDLNAVVMAGATFKLSGFTELTLLRNGFASLSAGTGNTSDVLFNTEFALGKWFNDVSGVRISAGSSTAFLKETVKSNTIPTESSDKEFNISLSADYLCNLSNLIMERRDKRFSVLFIAGIGSYFPGADASRDIVINGRFGFQGNIRLSKHYEVWLEPRVNMYKENIKRVDEQYPLRASMGLMAGMNYTF